VRTNGFYLSTKILDRRESLVFVQNNKVVETTFVAASGLYRFQSNHQLYLVLFYLLKIIKFFFGMED